MLLRASRYNHLCAVDGSHIGLQGRTGALARLDSVERGILRHAAGGDGVAGSAADGRLGALLASGFLVPDGTDELLMLRRLYYSSNYGAGTLDMVLAPTMDCNMDCAYCFQGGPPPASMPPAVHDAVVALARRGLKRARHLRVLWYGGEPLLRQDIIGSLSPALRGAADENGASYAATLITNGTLLTAGAAAALAGDGVTRAQVTIDGPAAVHDSLRPLKGGTPSWRVIMDNVAAAARHIEVAVRATVAPGGAGSALDLCQALDVWGVPAGVSVHPAPMHEGRRCASADCLTDGRFMREMLVAIERRGESHPRLELPYPKPRPSCLATSGSAYGIDAWGDVHRCLETFGRREEAVGNLLGDTSWNQRLQRWLEADPFLGEARCLSCRWLPQCFGGCPRHYLDVGRRLCVGFKGNLKAYLAFTLRRGGGAPGGHGGQVLNDGERRD